jgi:hypothetical protein
LSQDSQPFCLYFVFQTGSVTPDPPTCVSWVAEITVVQLCLALCMCFKGKCNRVCCWTGFGVRGTGRAETKVKTLSLSSWLNEGASLGERGLGLGIDSEECEISSFWAWAINLENKDFLNFLTIA